MEPKIPPMKPIGNRLQEGINLKMTAKGYYYWDINAYGDLSEAMIIRIKEIDRVLRGEFPQNVSTLPTEFGPTRE